MDRRTNLVFCRLAGNSHQKASQEREALQSHAREQEDSRVCPSRIRAANIGAGPQGSQWSAQLGLLSHVELMDLTFLPSRPDEYMRLQSLRRELPGRKGSEPREGQPGVPSNNSTRSGS